MSAATVRKLQDLTERLGTRRKKKISTTWLTAPKEKVHETLQAQDTKLDQFLAIQQALNQTVLPFSTAFSLTNRAPISSLSSS